MKKENFYDDDDDENENNVDDDDENDKNKNNNANSSFSSSSWWWIPEKILKDFFDKTRLVVDNKNSFHYLLPPGTRFDVLLWRLCISGSDQVRIFESRHVVLRKCGFEQFAGV